MGQKMEKLAGGRGQMSLANRECQDCKTPAPDIAQMPFDQAPLEALRGSSNHVRCYWILARDEIAVTKSVGGGMGLGTEHLAGFGFGISKEVKKGAKTIIFLRKDNKEGGYLCCTCFAKKFPRIMNAARAELLPVAQFLYYDSVSDELCGVDQSTSKE